MGIQNTAFQVNPQVSPGDPEPLCPLSVAALGADVFSYQELSLAIMEGVWMASAYLSYKIQ